mmetsp:Transcript_120349/g.236521  ORF Transcript_120349/g.236521 Transcript_120349/m.236521 type:complete len:264 (+) Transcript_120349:72-863(+)|eukprot:CAMPEP_0170380306 /NCGR_PEP_ID=MMETSP0117_2-20130122/13807_1 /TAXON_ID=400756 /ORGANISM="Durinskia baltica, Strain CSIRO CS-38" /LENGTH=263 /DNA_ID=CAMNT_0010635805 /DNA_START=52 /DNA_END=843 /DNA_ORIENTATION=+
MSCCPPNAEKYLAASGPTNGQCLTLASGQEVYCSAPATSGKKGVLIIPDVYGWNGGRTRSIADMFAEAGYLAVVPKLMVPPLEGGTDGDGLYPTFSFETDVAKFPPYMSQFDWKGALDKRIADSVAYLKEQGVEKIAGVGFCWGGWVLCNALAEELGESFVCGCIPHPSVQLENMIFQRNVLALFENVKKPLMLLNAKGDSEDYHTEGAWFKAHHARHPTAEAHNYLNMNHGFVSRGDPKDPETQAAATEAVHHCFRFIAAHM